MPTTSQRDTKLDKAIAKYQAAIAKNISEGEILWNRYSALLLFNSILISAIGLSYQTSIRLPLIITASLPIAGLLSCYLWFIVTLRGFQWTTYWIVTAREIEEEYLNDKIKYLNPTLNGKDKRNEIIGWPNTRFSSYLLILITGVIYLFILHSLVINNLHLTTNIPTQAQTTVTPHK